MSPHRPIVSSRSIASSAIAVALALAVLLPPPLATASTGPYLVDDLRVGGSSEPRSLTASAGRLFFTAHDGASGRELYVSDGTSEGTRRVKDIRRGARGSSPRDLVNVDGVVYFSAHDGIRGRELWKSDGTAAGTQLVHDIRPGTAGSNPSRLTRYDGRVFFAADDGMRGVELWKSDGSAAGTRLVKNINPGEGSFPHELVAAAGLLFFVAQPLDTSYGHGQDRLWKTDGTRAGTMQVPYDYTSDFDAIGQPWGLVRVGRLLFFSTWPTKLGDFGLWRSDGSRAGTREVLGDTAWDVTAVSGTAFFRRGNLGDRLWRSDGTAGTTVEVTRIHHRPIGIAGAAGGLAYLDVGSDLWVSDGTAAGTVEVAIGTCPSHVTGFEQRVYFAGGPWDEDPETCGDQELWTSDGTPSGTMLVRDLHLAGSSAPRHLTKVGAALYFTADDGVTDRELWRYVP